MKTRGIFLFLVGLFFLSSIAGWSAPAPEVETDSLTPAAESQNSGDVTQKAAVEETEADDNDFLDFEYKEPEPIAAPKAFPLLIKTVFSLIIIIGLIYLTVYVVKQFIGRRSAIQQSGKLIKTLDVIYLTPQQAVYLLGVPEKILVIGATDQNMNLLSEITDPRVIESIKETGVVSLKSKLNFKEQLKKFSGNFES